MGLFITFEGVEGCGKTTQIRLLTDLLAGRGHKVRMTREPGGCPIADRIRSILLDGSNSAMTPMAELLLYAAARAQHISEVIAPALASGSMVLCDRFTDATLAYQGFGRGLDRKTIADLNMLARGEYTPDLTLLFDCPVEVGLSRAISPVNEHGIREERFEQESLDFHRKVRDGYLELARMEPARFRIIDANRDISVVADEVAAVVLERIGR